MVTNSPGVNLEPESLPGVWGGGDYNFKGLLKNGKETVELTGEREGGWWSERWVMCVLITPTLVFTNASSGILLILTLSPWLSSL